MAFFRFAKNFIDIREREDADKKMKFDLNDIDGTDLAEARVLTESEQHGRKLMNLHNNEAGRIVSYHLSTNTTWTSTSMKHIKLVSNLT